MKIIVLLAGAALLSSPAVAQNVGTATAVNPTSQGTAPGGGAVVLRVGANVVHKERIETTSAGSVQLLFLDKSSLSIGPNSSILIDEFVYNPSSGSGHMVASLAKGALRFVGGQLSHQGDATITTSAATIGIRGGTGTIGWGQYGLRVIDHNGLFTMSNGGCGPKMIRRHDYGSWVRDWKTCPTDPELVPAEEIAFYLKTLTSQTGQNGGVPGLTTAQVGGIGTVVNIPPDFPPVPTGNGESNAFTIQIQGTQQGTGVTPPRYSFTNGR